MATLNELRCAEDDMRRLLEDEGLPAPDDVEYRDDSILLLWHDTKVAVIVDVTEPPPERVGRGGFEPPSDGF
jgi:hypothetical protein